MQTTKVQTVEEYIEKAPKEVQAKIEQMRKIILEVAGNVEEKISYSMPYYGYMGTRLVYFGFAKKHIGLYIMPPAVQVHRKELEHYSTSKDVTIRFPLDEELPVALIKKMIKTTMTAIEEKKKSK
jgi:uncharacterized protein YdhG (YjbR/CyaY superfamily)